MARAVLYITSDIFLTFCIIGIGVSSIIFRLNEGGPMWVRNGANCRTRDREKRVGLHRDIKFNQQDQSMVGNSPHTLAPSQLKYMGYCMASQEGRKNTPIPHGRRFPKPLWTSIAPCRQVWLNHLPNFVTLLQLLPQAANTGEHWPEGNDKSSRISSPSLKFREKVKSTDASGAPKKQAVWSSVASYAVHLVFVF